MISLSHSAEYRHARRTAVSDSDHRTPEQRDRDRVMFTTAVQRLAGVTQVASALEGFPFHNRLTHTLEMSQLGRRLAERIIEDNSKDTLQALGCISPDVVETACLAHDTGHPPFGHTAEAELDRLAVAAGLREGFEGNAQSLRTVTTLEPYRPNLLGLNLTRATIRALMKYPWTRSNTPPHTAKWGVYESDSDVLEWAFEAESEPVCRSPEAAIMDIADDIVYSVHDLHDFFRCRFIPLDILKRGGAELEYFLEHAYDNRTALPKLISQQLPSALRSQFLSLLKDYILVDEPYCGTMRDQASLRLMTSNLIKRFRDAVCVGPGRPQIALREDAQTELSLLRELTVVYVHRNSTLYLQRRGYKHVVEKLFGAFRECATSRSYDMFPRHYSQILEDPDMLVKFCGSDDVSARVRVTVDFISSLTDSQALQLYRRLTGTVPGVVTDPIAF